MADMGFVEEFTYRCLLNQYPRPSETRLRIVQHLVMHEQPFDPEEIVSELAADATRSTIYRTLAMLEEFGMVTRDQCRVSIKKPPGIE